MDKTVSLNPIDQIKKLFEVNGDEGEMVFRHIKYDKELDNDSDFQIIRKGSHDGTLSFTLRLLTAALKPLINMEAYYKKDISEDEIKKLERIEYVVGNIKLESKYGNVKTGAGVISGVTDTVSIPVRCKYTFKG